MARNKYVGYCYECGRQIKLGYGHFERFAVLGEFIVFNTRYEE